MAKLGYGPDHRLPIKTSVRDLPYLRDPAVLLNDQLKEVYIDGELEVIDTTKWFPRVMRHDYTVALAPLGVGDPDQTLYNVYGCGGDLNYNGYCNAEVDQLIDRQSAEADPEKKEAWLTLIVIGGGPTGVEMAGQIGELARDTLRRDFRAIDTRRCRILLIEAAGRLLTGFPPSLSEKAARSLRRLGK